MAADDPHHEFESKKSLGILRPGDELFDGALLFYRALLDVIQEVASRCVVPTADERCRCSA